MEQKKDLSYQYPHIASALWKKLLQHTQETQLNIEKTKQIQKCAANTGNKLDRNIYLIAISSVYLNWEASEGNARCISAIISESCNQNVKINLRH